MQKKISSGLIAILLLALILPVSLHAAVVGRFTQVRGEVDLLKGGKIPGLPVKLRDGVEPGDVIRTKARARAELTMMDDSILVLAPESRLAVADYSYNRATNERRAVIRLFKGLVHTVVNRIIQTEEPDFIMETHTAVIGVRGTDWYTLLAPAFSSVYLARGTLGVSSNLPTIPAQLLLQSMHFTQVPMGKQPFLAKPMSMEMIGILERLMDTGIVAGGLLGPGGLPPVGGEYQLPPGLPTSPDQRLRQEFYTPPVLQPQPQIPAPTPGPSHGPSSPSSPSTS
ncbi:MAG: FecR family protein [Desulfobaccales bacterium]